MAVTTTYEFDFLQLLDITQGSAQSNVEALGLDNGGFAVGGESGGSSALDVYSPNITDTGGNGLVGGNLAMDQLSDGKIIAVSAQPLSSDSLFILDSVTGSANFSAATSNNLTNFDVAGLAAGGFWIASEATDIVVVRYNNSGTELGSFTITDGGAQLRAPRIAGLDGGNIAVAYERRVAVDSVQVHYAIYDPTGAFVAGLSAVDALGAVNESPSITALDGGGFAIVYESDREGNGTVDTILTVFNSAGVRQGVYNISNPGLDDDGSNDLNPTVTQLSNGLIAVAWDNTLFDSDTYISLVDPANGSILASTFITGGENINDATGSASLAGVALGRLAAFHTNTTDSDIDGELLQGVRTSIGDAANDVIVGDDFVDVMNGGEGNDTLNGGLGIDQLTGGGGNDTFHVDNFDDKVFEVSGQGFDIIFASSSFTLAGNQSIEELRASPQSSTLPINLSGNGFSQLLSGNNGSNSLNGNGGADQMYGRQGNDIYIVDNIGDVTYETAGSGNDSVFAKASYALAAGQSIETLATTAQSGTTAINLTGNNINQTINGNNGSNVINGGGGTDTLFGRQGSDTFVFSSALAAGNRGNIGDYFVASDTIQLSQAIFTEIGATLDAAEFVIGPAATTTSHRIIYNSVAGTLLYDRDGSGALGAQQFGTISAGLAMIAAEFQMIA